MKVNFVYLSRKIFLELLQSKLRIYRIHFFCFQSIYINNNTTVVFETKNWITTSYINILCVKHMQDYFTIFRYRVRTSGSRSRSRSLEKRDRRDSLKDKDITSKPGTPTHDTNHGETDGRINNNVPNVPSAVQGSKKRCRDFDEKGKRSNVF